MPKLSDEEWELCEKPVCHNEILKAIKDLFNSRTPGWDGLPADWHKFFWIDIKYLLSDSVNYALSNDLSIKQKRGVIILFKTLEHLNFSNIFIGYVKTMYTDIESTVLNNGNSENLGNFREEWDKDVHFLHSYS